MTEKNKSIRNFPNYGNVPKLRFSEFTKEWELKKLGDIGEIVNGLTYNPDNIDDSGILVLRSSNVQNRIVTLKDNVFVKTEKFNPVRENDILICVRNGSKNLIGKNAIIKKENEGLAFGAFMTVFRSPYNKFVFQWFDTKQYKEIVNKNLGATINSINGSDLKKFKIPFPSLDEQKKISSLLSLVDDRIELSMKIISHLKTSIRSYRKKLFSQKIRFKDENENYFPKWETKKIKDILKIGSGRDYKHLEAGTIPVYGTGGIITFVDSFLYDGETVCIGRKGTIDRPLYFDGKLWTVDTLFYTHSFNNSIPKFIFHIFQSINWKEYNEASGVPSLSKSTIENITVKIPSVEEQTKIANFLFSIGAKIETEKKILNQYETQKKYLLANLFV